MPHIADFRLSQFASDKVDKCGKHIGSKSFGKLYAIEKFFRVIIHSVPAIQISADWWEEAVDKIIREKASGAERFRRNCLKKPGHSKPGVHGIYYVNLNDLNEIMRANAHLFDPIIPNLDKSSKPM